MSGYLSQGDDWLTNMAIPKITFLRWNDNAIIDSIRIVWADRAQDYSGMTSGVLSSMLGDGRRFPDVKTHI